MRDILKDNRPASERPIGFVTVNGKTLPVTKTDIMVAKVSLQTMQKAIETQLRFQQAGGRWFFRRVLMDQLLDNLLAYKEMMPDDYKYHCYA